MVFDWDLLRNPNIVIIVLFLQQPTCPVPLSPFIKIVLTSPPRPLLTKREGRRVWG